MLTMELVPLGHLDPAPYNPRKISEQQLEALTRSMKEFGVVDPVIANRDGTVIGGHQRIKAAERLGIPELPVIYVDLPKEKEKALNLALNRISGEWDESLLDALLRDLELLDVDLSLTGFTEEELADILGHDAIEDYPEDPGADHDRAEELQKKWGTETGQLWEVGEHRILCGDATNEEDLARLIGDGEARLCWTDPPWNVAYGKSANPRYRQRSIANDDLGSDFPAFAAEFCAGIHRSLAPGAPIYMAMSAQEWPVIDKALRTAGFHWSSTIIWVKDHAVLSRKDYHTRYEPLWYGWKEGAPRLVELTDRKQNDVWEIDRPVRSEEHPTMKPVELVARSLTNSSRRGDVVFDPFLGSGTTMVAAEQAGRVCYGMELESKYVAVTLERVSGMGLQAHQAYGTLEGRQA